MSLVAAKCTQCGANLKIDNTLEAAVCPHCKTPFITEKAINNYNTYNQSTYNIQHADLQVNDEKSIENRLKNAEVFLTKHKDYKKAMELFKEISEDAPDDYRTWWGIVRTGTAEFSNKRVGKKYTTLSSGTVVIPYADFYDKALRVAPEEAKGHLIKIWQEYQEYLKPEILRVSHEIKQDLKSSRDSYESKLKDLNRIREHCIKEIETCQRIIDGKTSIITKLIYLILYILLFILGKWLLTGPYSWSGILAVLGLLSIVSGVWLTFSGIMGVLFSGFDEKEAERKMPNLIKELNSVDSNISSIKQDIQRFDAQIAATENPNNRLKQNV